MTRSLWDVFLQSASMRADSPALHAERTYKYGELLQLATAAQSHLSAMGIGQGDRVGISLHRGVDLIVAVLACVGSGATYVPLDPDYPIQRLRYMADDSNVRLIMTSKEVWAAIEPLERPALDVSSSSRLGLYDLRDAGSVQARDGAYVIYTSGSTGAPKGVLVTHSNVLSLLDAALPLFDFKPSDRWSLFHSYNFDFSVWELWGAFATGASTETVPAEVMSSPPDFCQFLQSRRITVLNQVPSIFARVVEAAKSSITGPLSIDLRYVIFGGERLHVTLINDAKRDGCVTAGTRFINMYGITETTVHATFHELGGEDLERIAVSPIGHALPNLDIRLVEDGAIVPEGEPGEMFLSGDGVALGYVGDSAKTSEKFVTMDLGDGARTYYISGDLARRNAHGIFEYLGRADSQVKLRGFRIELGEIEHCLMAHPEVKVAVVSVEASRLGAPSLTAYVEFDVHVASTSLPSAAQMRAFCLESLPSHMVPSRFVYVKTFQYALSGKLLRKGLSELERVGAAS